MPAAARRFWDRVRKMLHDPLPPGSMAGLETAVTRSSVVGRMHVVDSLRRYGASLLRTAGTRPAHCVAAEAAFLRKVEAEEGAREGSSGGRPRRAAARRSAAPPPHPRTAACSGTRAGGHGQWSYAAPPALRPDGSARREGEPACSHDDEDGAPLAATADVGSLVDLGELAARCPSLPPASTPELASAHLRQQAARHVVAAAAEVEGEARRVATTSEGAEAGAAAVAECVRTTLQRTRNSLGALWPVALEELALRWRLECVAKNNLDGLQRLRTRVALEVETEPVREAVFAEEQRVLAAYAEMRRRQGGRATGRRR